MIRPRNIYRITPGQRRGDFLLPGESVKIYLNPIERTLYRLFLNHPEGIATDALRRHKEELHTLYNHETVFENKHQIETTMESIMSENKNLFYTTVARIKKKFVTELGSRKAAPYIIKRNKSGTYKTRAALSEAG